MGVQKMTSSVKGGWRGTGAWGDPYRAQARDYANSRCVETSNADPRKGEPCTVVIETDATTAAQIATDPRFTTVAVVAAPAVK